MSVYRQAGCANWFIQFHYCGQKFYRRTGTSNRQEAEVIERTERERVKGLGLVPPLRPRRVVQCERYRGLCVCGQHAWSVLTMGYVTIVSPEDSRLLETADLVRKNNL